MKGRLRLKGYWVMTWLGLMINTAAIPIIALVVFSGPPLQVANLTIASSIAWPACVLGIVASSGLLAQRNWGVILAITSLSMALATSLPYGIVRLIIVKDFYSIGSFSILFSIVNLLALIYWCQPSHRRNMRL